VRGKYCLVMTFHDIAAAIGTALLLSPPLVNRRLMPACDCVD
jgi:hypothetical protein